MITNRFFRNAFALGLTLVFAATVLAQAPPAPPVPTATTPATARPAAQPTPSVPPMPADRKAYMDAARLKDPVKKIAALEKFMTDFPNSSMLYSGHMAIFETLVKNNPTEKERIMLHAGKTIEKAEDFMKASLYSSLASRLNDAGVWLDEAEKLATDGLAATEAELLKSAKQRKSTYLALLGRIYLKKGKLKEAEKNLRLAAEYNPQSASAVAGLAELYQKKGDEKLALENYAKAAVMGKVTKEQRTQLETLYRKTHNGALAGLEDKLDADYTRLNPSPFTVAHYTPTPKRSSRTVLAEVFTGAACGPCVAADLAFDQMLERYKREEVMVLMYHMHIPGPDPMTNFNTLARGKYYAVNGVPSYALDGNKQQGGGGPREFTKRIYDNVNPEVERLLEKAAEAVLKLDVAFDGALVKSKVALDKFSGDAANLKLHIVLAEERLRYTGENGVRFHPMAVRALAGKDGAGLPVTAPGAAMAEWTFDLAAVSAENKRHLDDFEKERGSETPIFTERLEKLDPNNLVVVAFVQDDKSKAILQTTLLKVKPQVASSGR